MRSASVDLSTLDPTAMFSTFRVFFGELKCPYSPLYRFFEFSSFWGDFTRDALASGAKLIESQYRTRRASHRSEESQKMIEYDRKMIENGRKRAEMAERTWSEMIENGRKWSEMHKNSKNQYRGL